MSKILVGLLGRWVILRVKSFGKDMRAGGPKLHDQMVKELTSAGLAVERFAEIWLVGRTTRYGNQEK
jgi:hypothetical protein